MKNKNLVMGVVLILIGLAWILSNLGLIDINLYSSFLLIIRGFFDLWPVILIIVGIGIIFKNDMLSTILWVLFLVLLIIYSLFFKGDILNTRSNDYLEEKIYTEEINDRVELGNLDLDIGASNFTISSTDDKLIRLKQDGAFKYKVTSKGNVENVELSNKSTNLYNTGPRNLSLEINKNIPWKLDIDVGAVSGDLDLKDIIVKDIDLDMGAGNLEISLGNLSEKSYLDLDAGASKITINLPKDSGLKVDFDGALNSSNIDSLALTKLGDGNYISNNYEEAKVKFEIEVDMGVGSFEINFY